MPHKRITLSHTGLSISDPRAKEPHPAYQQQLDAYAWLLGENGSP